MQPSNVLLQQFPPPVPSENLSSIISSLNQYALAIDVALAALWFFVAFRAGWMAFFFRTTLIGGLAFGVYAAHGIMGRKIEKELERVRMNMHKQRGEKVRCSSAHLRTVPDDALSSLLLLRKASSGSTASLTSSGPSSTLRSSFLSST